MDISPEEDQLMNDLYKHLSKKIMTAITDDLETAECGGMKKGRAWSMVMRALLRPAATGCCLLGISRVEFMRMCGDVYVIVNKYEKHK